MFNGADASDPIPAGAAILLGLLLIAAGVILLEVGRRSKAGTLRRNWIVGVRTSATLHSDEAWNIAHRVAGSTLQVGAVAPIAAGVITLFRPANWIAATVILVSLGWLVIWVVISGRRGVSAANSAET